MHCEARVCFPQSIAAQQSTSFLNSISTDKPKLTARNKIPCGFCDWNPKSTVFQIRILDPYAIYSCQDEALGAVYKAASRLMPIQILPGMKKKLSEFEDILVVATNNALNSTVGVSVASAIKFYVDLSLISKDIDKFRVQLNKFVPGSKLVEDRIIRNLAESLDVDRALIVSPEKAVDLKSFVENCREEFTMLKQ
jgi:hypothetical protein